MDDPDEADERPGVMRGLAMGGAAVAVAGLLFASWHEGWAPRVRALFEPAPPIAVIAHTSPVASAADRRSPPSFDIVRVSPRGDTVLAGRAEAGAEVMVERDGSEIGRTTADAQGQWVMLPKGPLTPGASTLTVAARTRAGGTLAGDTPVMVAVPEPTAMRSEEPGRAGVEAVAPAVGNDASGSAKPPMAGARMFADRDPSRGVAAPTRSPAANGMDAFVRPMVVATPLDGPARFLSSATASAGRLGLDFVDYDDHGAIRFAGHAPSGTTVRTYIDNIPAGDTVADVGGRWELIPVIGVVSGDHRIRVDQLGTGGKVGARVELPFQRASVEQTEVAEGHIVVQPSQTLWRIARRAYGKGVLYTEIFRANRDQIKDPARIYPGQVFAIPAAPAAVSPRASAAVARSSSAGVDHSASAAASPPLSSPASLSTSR